MSSFLKHNCLVNFSSYSDHTLSIDKGTQILEFPFLIRPCKDFWDSVIYEVPAFCNSSGKSGPLLAYWFALLSLILLASLCKRAVTGTSFLQLESVFESMASSSFSTSQTISTCRRSTSLFVTGLMTSCDQNPSVSCKNSGPLLHLPLRSRTCIPLDTSSATFGSPGMFSLAWVRIPLNFFHSARHKWLKNCATDCMARQGQLSYR